MDHLPGDSYPTNVLIKPITFSMLIVFINNQQKIKALCIVLKHSYMY